MLVCVCMCVCTCVCVCVFACMHACVWSCACVCIHVCMCVFIFVVVECVCVCVCVCVHVCVSVCLSADGFVSVCVYVYVCMKIHTLQISVLPNCDEKGLKNVIKWLYQDPEPLLCLHQETDPLGAIPLAGYTFSRHLDSGRDFCFKAEKYGARTYCFMTDNRDTMTE